MILLYIDPGSGSWMAQAVIAAILAIAYGLKDARRWLGTIVRKLFKKRAPNE